MSLFKNTIQVRVDKSHLFTLGEKMYRESIEFVRELVNNAYDADASVVNVIVKDDRIEVRDDGLGMNERNLEQFFTIGSEEKKTHSVSPRFGRKRIGQFGIGKFSALALADQFIVESVKGGNKYTVTFNRHSWREEKDWELPIHKEKATVLDAEGTRIILNNLVKKVSLVEVEKYLRDSVPLRAKRFSVFVNNKKISARQVPGRSIPINIKTMHGVIEGEIIIALNARDVVDPGIECRVKQALIKRSFFGMDKKHQQGINRITGSINADFLPLISSRSDFIVDSEEYKIFHQLMEVQLEKILSELKKQNDTKNFEKINRELKDVMNQIRGALLLNPDFVPQGRAAARLKKEGRKKVAAASLALDNDDAEAKNENEKDEAEKINNDKDGRDDVDKNKTKDKKEKKDELKINVKPVVVKQIRLKKFGISCGIVSLGLEGSEVMSQGNMIYINQDHALYQHLYKKRDLLTMHLYRLITQEIVLMKKLRITAADAFAYQGKLMKDAVCGEQ